MCCMPSKDHLLMLFIDLLFSKIGSNFAVYPFETKIKRYLWYCDHGLKYSWMHRHTTNIMFYSVKKGYIYMEYIPMPSKTSFL